MKYFLSLPSKRLYRLRSIKRARVACPRSSEEGLACPALSDRRAPARLEAHSIHFLAPGVANVFTISLNVQAGRIRVLQI